MLNFWAKRTFGGRECEAFPTATGGRHGDGDWTHPDLVVVCYPRRRPYADSPKDLHSFEIEDRAGFGVASVYQAHEQSYGADFAWVMTFAVPTGHAKDRAD